MRISVEVDLDKIPEGLVVGMILQTLAADMLIPLGMNDLRRPLQKDPAREFAVISELKDRNGEHIIGRVTLSAGEFDATELIPPQDSFASDMGTSVVDAMEQAARRKQ